MLSAASALYLNMRYSFHNPLFIESVLTIFCFVITFTTTLILICLSGSELRKHYPKNPFTKDNELKTCIALSFTFLWFSLIETSIVISSSVFRQPGFIILAEVPIPFFLSFYPAIIYGSQSSLRFKLKQNFISRCCCKKNSSSHTQMV